MVVLKVINVNFFLLLFSEASEKVEGGIKLNINSNSTFLLPVFLLRSFVEGSGRQRSNKLKIKLLNSDINNSYF
jgi:hypothetical protein